MLYLKITIPSPRPPKNRSLASPAPACPRCGESGRVRRVVILVGGEGREAVEKSCQYFADNWKKHEFEEVPPAWWEALRLAAFVFCNR